MPLVQLRVDKTPNRIEIFLNITFLTKKSTLPVKKIKVD